MKQTWEDIFRQKSSEELLGILRNGTIYEKDLVKKVLKDRNIDINNIHQYEEIFELERLINEEHEFNTGLSERFKNNAFGFDILAVFPIVIIPIIIVSIGSLVFQLTGLVDKDIPNTIISIVILIFVEVLTISLFKKRKERIKLRNERIKYLKKKLDK